MIVIYLLILLFSCTKKKKTQTIISTTNPPLSDNHFDMLLKLWVEQRQIQKSQEQMVKQLQQELFNTKLEITQNIYDLNKTSCKKEVSDKCSELNEVLTHTNRHTEYVTVSTNYHCEG